VVEFGMSEGAFAALTGFWERGYLIRNPDVAGRWWRAGFAWFAAGAAIALLALVAGVAVLLWLENYTGAGAAWTSGLLTGGPIALRGLPLMMCYRRWVAVKEQMELDGFRFDQGDSTYPPSRIDIMTGRVRVT
jgi:hypothetical protein